MIRIFILITFMASAGYVIAQDSTRIKNNHDATDTSTDKLNGGALIDPIHTDNTIPQQKKAGGDPESRIKDIENQIASLKPQVMKTTDTSLKNSLASIENSKNDLKSRLNESKDPKTWDKWEKDYAELKQKIEKLKSSVH